jgi:hypothetical protein
VAKAAAQRVAAVGWPVLAAPETENEALAEIARRMAATVARM